LTFAKRDIHMKKSLIKLLACPSCLLKVRLKTSEKEEAGEILEGELTCTGCGADFPIQFGIPIFLSPEEKESHVAKSFGFEWQMQHKGAFEKDAVFGRTLDEDIEYFFNAFAIAPEQIKNKLVLDAGCGSGALTVELAKRFPDCTFVGLDINPAIMKVYENSIDLPNLYVVRASVFSIPFLEETFDLVWSNGVIHHTGNTRGAFNSVIRQVKTGGRAYLWVYQKKLSPMVALRILLIPLGLKYWNHEFLYHFCQLISLPTWLVVKVFALFGKLRFTRKHTHLRILTQNRGYNELVLTWFDVLSPKYRSTYSKSEFESWFVQNNFQDIAHYWWPVGISGKRT